MNKWLRQIPIGCVVFGLLFTAGQGIAADIKERSIKLGYVLPEDHPLGLGAKKWSELLAQKSGGKIKARTYPAGAIGGDTQMISSLQGGIQELGLITSAPIVGVVKEFGVLDLPFIFSNEKEADAVLDGPVGQKLLAKLSDKGMVGLGWMENGFRNVTSSKRPITKAEDLQGLKIRVMQNPVYLDVFNTLGANAVPMAFTELYTALEQKAVDAQENPLAIINANKFNEVQKYLSATRHSYSPFAVIASKKFWDKLTPDEQKLFKETAIEASAYQRKVLREADRKLFAELKTKGMEVNELSPQELANMREKLRPVIDKYAKEIGEDTVKETFAEIDKVRKQK